MRKHRLSGPNVVHSRGRKVQVSGDFVKLSDLRKLTKSEQVAAVCYRVRGTELEFLLVRTRGGARWTFPKGSAELGLTPAQTAALEAFEEAGVHGRIEQTSFARYFSRKYTKSKRKCLPKDLMVNAHLCQVLRLARPKEMGRNRTWFSVEEATRRLREGREDGHAAEIARIIEKAVSRIETLHRGLARDEVYESAMLRSSERRSLALRPFKKDALQDVQFEAESQLYVGKRVPLLSNSLRRVDIAVRSLQPYKQPKKLLQGDVLPCVLPFGAAPPLSPGSNRGTKPTTPEVSVKGK
jgi:8-oxo-dGTP pyrophosphatase MutT (NUDIX family)